MLLLLLPALFAGLVAIAVTVAIERWGGRVGGLLGTLPTTIVPASLGIWFGVGGSHGGLGAEDLAQAMHSVPPGMLLNAGFLWLWRALPPRLPAMGLGLRLALMTLLSLSAWGLAALSLALGLPRLPGGASLALATLTTAVLIGVGVLACLARRPSPRGTRSVGLGTLLARGALAGGAVGFAVWLAAVGGPVAGGVASVFPAIFLTTMVSLWLSQGEAVPAGAVGPMMLGSASVASYAIFCAALIPALGAVPGTAAAWLAAVGSTTLPAFFWLGRRALRAEPATSRTGATP